MPASPTLDSIQKIREERHARYQAKGEPAGAGFRHQAALWNAYLDARGLDVGAPIRVVDIPALMALMKIGRYAVNPKHADNAVDGANYMIIAGDMNDPSYTMQGLPVTLEDINEIDRQMQLARVSPLPDAAPAGNEKDADRPSVAAAERSRGVEVDVGPVPGFDHNGDSKMPKTDFQVTRDDRLAVERDRIAKENAQRKEIVS